MLATLNLQLSRHLPKLHRFLKESLARTNLPVPKMLQGRVVWAHSRLFKSQPSDLHVLRWIAGSLRPGDVFFDVGANQGWMSMVAARKIGPTGRVVAFEPSPPLVEFLSYHKRVNRLSQMNVISKAVSNKDETGVPFNLVGDGNAFMNSLSHTEIAEISPRNRTVIDIETITLDAFSLQSELVPNLIKVDTEGSELLVCEGAKGLFASHHPALIIATHPLWLPKGQKIEDLFGLLEGFGYRIVDSVIYEYKGADFGDYLCVAD